MGLDQAARMKSIVQSPESESLGAPTSGPACPGEQCGLRRVGDRRSGFVSRRAAIGLGAAGVVGLAGVVSLFDLFSKWRESEAPADIFKGDASSGELWELWQKRGWVKEGRH